MRVVAGTHGGRRLAVPEGRQTRPTTDRVREAVFNSLYSLGVVEDAVVLDAFAGSGALGIEALSRGARSATFAETGRDALEVLRSNLASLDLEDRSSVVAADGVAMVAGAEGFDLLLLDPPYDFDGWPALLASIAGATVVIESDRAIELPEEWSSHRVRQYGGTVVTLATAPDASGGLSR